MAGPTRSASGWNSADFTASSYASSAGGFISELWTPKMVEQFYAASVFGEVSSTEYSGEIVNHGDSVKIRVTPAITINDYEVGQALVYQTPTANFVDLNINRAKSFSLAIDNVEKYQSDLNLMDNFATAASESLKVSIDTTVLASMKGDATIAAANKGATAGAISGNLNLGSDDATAANQAVQLTAATVIDYILKHGQALDEQNTPETGRWIIIPAFVGRLLKSSDLKDASITGDAKSVMRNGRLGMIDRFTVYTSNNLPAATQTDEAAANARMVYAGHPSCFAFASQITESETLPNPDTFGQLMRGLQVFGSKIVKGEGITEGCVYE